MGGSANVRAALEAGVKKVNIVEVKSDKKGIDLLIQKKVGAVLSSYISLDYLMKTDPELSLNNNLVMASYIPKLGEIGFGFPQDSSLTEIINRTLKELQSEGALRKICLKYIEKEKMTGCLL